MDNSIVQVNNIFEQPWWLDAVASNQWECIEIRNNGMLVARFPYALLYKYGMKMVCNPVSTPTLGPWIENANLKIAYKLANEKEIITEIINKLPDKTIIDIRLACHQDYVLPFIWKGFKVYPYFTYRFEDLSDLIAIQENITNRFRNNIKKAEKVVNIRDDLSIDIMNYLLNKTFQHQKRKSPINYDILKRIHSQCIEHNACKFLVAQDNQGKYHAGAYFVYDSNVCYYLFGGSDPEYRNSGAVSLLLWKGIQFASTVSKAFDFEGSMIESIEALFRQTGAKPHVYYRVVRGNVRYYLLESIKLKIKKLLRYK